MASDSSEESPPQVSKMEWCTEGLEHIISKVENTRTPSVILVRDNGPVSDDFEKAVTSEFSFPNLEYMAFKIRVTDEVVVDGVNQNVYKLLETIYSNIPVPSILVVQNGIPVTVINRQLTTGQIQSAISRSFNEIINENHADLDDDMPTASSSQNQMFEIVGNVVGGFVVHGNEALPQGIMDDGVEVIDLTDDAEQMTPQPGPGIPFVHSGGMGYGEAPAEYGEPPVEDTEPPVEAGPSVTVPLDTTSLGSEGVTYIRFRLPSDKMEMHAFPSELNLGMVKQFMCRRLGLVAINLILPYPMRIFEQEEDDSTLAQLGLVPSAALVIEENQEYLMPSTSNNAPPTEPKQNLAGKRKAMDEPDQQFEDSDSDEPEIVEVIQNTDFIPRYAYPIFNRLTNAPYDPRDAVVSPRTVAGFGGLELDAEGFPVYDERLFWDYT